MTKSIADEPAGIIGKDDAEEYIRLMVHIRLSQVIVAEEYKLRALKPPLHLALGHEPIAAATRLAFGINDRLLLSHRNIHYQLAFGGHARSIISELGQQHDGLAGGKFAMMNLVNPPAGLIYTSSILGNNLPVSVGVGLSLSMSALGACAWVVTGDGAIEEGAFYESMVLGRSLQVPLIVIVEDNDWSLATSVDERRYRFDLREICSGLGIHYINSSSHETEALLGSLQEARRLALKNSAPVIVRARVVTLGGYWVASPESPQGRRYINYHAGTIPDLTIDSHVHGPFGNEDPLQGYLEQSWVGAMRRSIAETVGA